MTSDGIREFYLLLQPDPQNVVKVTGMEERILNYI